MFATNLQEIMKKRIKLGTSDAWSTSHLFQQTSEPVYYIADCRILFVIPFSVKYGHDQRIVTIVINLSDRSSTLN